MSAATTAPESVRDRAYWRCPDWCRTPVEHHGWDVTRNGPPFTAHDGFSEGIERVRVSIGANVHVDGTVTDMFAELDVLDDRLSAEQARRLSGILLAAAEWLAAHQ